MSQLILYLAKLLPFGRDADYRLIRAAMVFTFLIFGYQKWFSFEAQQITPFISHSPLVFWLIPAFGVRGAGFFLGTTEWLFGGLIFLGFWNSGLGVLGALGSIVTFLGTVTIIPFLPNAWATEAGGFPAMNLPVAFLMKDVLFLAASFYLFKQDLTRAGLEVAPDRAPSDAQSRVIWRGLRHDRPADANVNRIATSVVVGAIMLACAFAAHSDNMVSFATGGYASGLRTKTMMHKMDTNHDNMVSRKEWIAFQGKVFAMLDKNKTGEVDESEYMSAYPDVAAFATGGYASGLLTPDMFKKIDTDGDGKISRQEFLSYQLKIFDMMDTSRTHRGMLGPAQFFATGGSPAP
jgi:uncharacterized membrane protein YkgB